MKNTDINELYNFIYMCVYHTDIENETKIKQDYHQLTISNQIHAINKIIPGHICIIFHYILQKHIHQETYL